MNAFAAKAGLVIGLLVGSASALAHHSEIAFDSSRRIALTGSVKSMEWSNQHGRILLDVDATGAGHGSESQAWVIETESPAKLISQGWTKHTLQPGDKIVIEISPARSGHRIGLVRLLTHVNGVAFANPRRYRPGGAHAHAINAF